MSKELLKKMNIDLSFVSSKAAKVENLVKIATDTKIENDEAADIARDNLKQIRDLSKTIDEERKKLLKPVRDATTYVNKQTSYYTDKLDEAKKTINGKIVQYSDIAAAQKRAEEEARRKEAEKRAADKETEVQRLLRIRSKMYSYLLGGTWIEKDGTQKTHQGVTTPEQANALFKQVHDTFPKAEEFGHLAKKSVTIFAEFKANCATVMAILKSDDLDAVKDKKLTSLRNDIIASGNELSVDLGVSVEEEVENETKEIEREVKNVSRSVRKTIKFRVIDKSQVRKELLTVDEKKVNEFSRVNREKLLEALKNNKQPLAGIEFYVEKTVI